MEATRLVLSLFVLIFLALPVIPLEGTSDELPEGLHPIYIVKEVVEVTSDWTDVTWIHGPHVLAVRHQVVEGADAPEFRCSVSGLGVHVVKRQYDTTRVVIEVEALTLRGDITAIVNTEAGALGYTKVQLSAYDITSRNFVNLGELLNGAHGPKDFELELSTLYEMPSAKANVEEAGTDLKKKVFAFYYPWYASPEGPSGFLEHWPEGYAHEPLIGFYDTADEAVILAHMAVAKQAGIDGFIASWWGIGTFEDMQFRRILSVAEGTGLMVTIYYDGLPWRKVTVEDAIRELSYVVTTYASSRSFLKDSGRPVILIYAAAGPDGVRDPSFWFEVRRRLEANVGPVVLNADVLDEGYSHVFDGFHTYIYLGDNVEEFYEDTIERFESGFLSSEEEVDEAFSSAYSGGEVSVELKPFSLTVIPGVDCTAIGQDLFLDREEGGFYAKYWKAAIELEAHSVLITTWNEWHEGTEIEPSKVYGFDYINMTRRFIEEYKQTSIPIPKANFSATVESLTQHPDLKGDGSIVLAAAETPALYVNVSVSGKEGVLSLDLEGDFCIYLKDRKRNRASIVIPSVPPQSELAVRAVYEAESIRPLLNISVTAYDVSGRLYELYKGQLRPVGPSSITASVSSESIEIGQSITVSGSLSPEGEGRPIILFYTKPDSSTLTRTGTTAADGSYSDTFNPDTVGTWRVQASWEGDEEFEGKTSQVIFFTVRKASTSVSIQTSQSQIIEGESITISGSINPAVSGAEVDIGFIKPDGSTFTGRSITSSNGSYGYSYTPTETGLWNIKASWKGNPKHQGASSTTASFTVIKKKGFIETPLGLATISVAILAAIITTILVLRRKTWHHSKRFGQCTNTNYRGRCVPRN